MESHLDFHAARALLEWQVELGVTEAICDAPLDRFRQPGPPEPANTATLPHAQDVAPVGVDAVALAREAAALATDLDGLASALAAYESCELKRGAKQTVFSDGNPKARVMIIGEAPGREEDLRGKPFVGQAGQLLDRMFAAIGMDRNAEDRETAIYITNVLPWRPPQNREPTPEEIAMMLPFLQRHIELVQPQLLVLMGNISCLALLGRKGITRMRGTWSSAFDLPALPMFHPAYLLRNPHAKREAWHDLLMLQSRLRDRA